MRFHRRPIAIAIGTAFLFPSMSWAESPAVLDDVVVSANRIEQVLPLNSTTPVSYTHLTLPTSDLV